MNIQIEDSKVGILHKIEPPNIVVLVELRYYNPREILRQEDQITSYDD
jgi:hypothetical protein